MQLRLNNIGIINDSTIKIDGLTVITGDNNSGKTTVGKALYAIIDAVSNIKQKHSNDCITYIRKSISKIQETLNIPASISRLYNKSESKIKIIFDDEYIYSLEDDENIISLFYDIKNVLIAVDLKEIFENNHITKSKIIEAFINNFDDNRIRAIKIWEHAISIIKDDPDLITYSKLALDYTLNMEFDDQIQPIAYPEKKSLIRLMDDNGKLYFDIPISGKHINSNRACFLQAPLDKAYFIDNPFVMDKLTNSRLYRTTLRRDDEVNSVFNYQRIFNHEEKLKTAIRIRKQTSLLEEIDIRSTITNIKELINQIIPGEFFSDNDGSYYIKNNIKLKTSNLATGSKLFSILKILLLKGEFNDRTLLILDEPESHLHPSWQNKFAEIIVLLIKEMKVTVLLTTHSSEMMLALETYMRKYQINENSNFYQTKMNPETGMVDYVCVNDDLGSIYADFLKYFAEMKALRDKIMFDLGEEDDN